MGQDHCHGATILKSCFCGQYFMNTLRPNKFQKLQLDSLIAAIFTMHIPNTHYSATLNVEVTKQPWFPPQGMFRYRSQEVDGKHLSQQKNPGL